jgi:TraY domain
MVCHNTAMINKLRKRAAGGGRKPKGPISGNSAWLQARITEDLRTRLEQAAAANGRSLSQEAQNRLQQSFDLPKELQDAWGPPEVRALAQLVSRVVRSVQHSAGATPFQGAGDLAWHRNAFTHAAVKAAVATVLVRFKPAGPIEVPPPVKELSERMPEHPEMATPDGVGHASALGVLSQYDIHQAPPKSSSAGAYYGEAYYVFPQIHRDLGDEK